MQPGAAEAWQALRVLDVNHVDVTRAASEQGEWPASLGSKIPDPVTHTLLFAADNSIIVTRSNEPLRDAAYCGCDVPEQ
jgi:hypothetical protein